MYSDVWSNKNNRFLSIRIWFFWFNIRLSLGSRYLSTGCVSIDSDRMFYSELIPQSKQFRSCRYEVVVSYADTLMDNVDAVFCNVSTRSVVELSLSPLFRRDYSALFKTIRQFFHKSRKTRLSANVTPRLPYSESLVPPHKPDPLYCWVWMALCSSLCPNSARTRICLPVIN